MPQNPSELIRQLLYISRAVRDFGDSDLRDLLYESRRNNLEHAVTGLLLYVNRHFMQCIEGRTDEIEQLITNIRKDSRNVDVTVLFDRPVAARSFAGWSMGFRVMSLLELREEGDFHDLQAVDDLARLESADKLLLSMMCEQYKVTAGRAL